MTLLITAIKQKKGLRTLSHYTLHLSDERQKLYNARNSFTSTTDTFCEVSHTTILILTKTQAARSLVLSTKVTIMLRFNQVIAPEAVSSLNSSQLSIITTRCWLLGSEEITKTLVLVHSKYSPSSSSSSRLWLNLTNNHQNFTISMWLCGRSWPG